MLLREPANEMVAENEADVKLLKGSSCTEDSTSCMHIPGMNEDGSRKGNNCAKDLGSQTRPGTPMLVGIQLCTSETRVPQASHRPPRGCLSPQVRVLSMLGFCAGCWSSVMEISCRKYCKCFKSF